MAGKGIPELLNYKQKGKDLNEFIKVPVSEKLAYCFGDPALTLMYTMTTTLLIYFYTNVVGISAGAVGMIMLLSRIFDGFSDVLMGTIIDRTHSKYGKARIWILRLAVPYALAAVLLFTMPPLGNMGKIIYAFVTYNIMNTVVYTAISQPFHALGSLMSRDRRERARRRGPSGRLRPELHVGGLQLVQPVYLLPVLVCRNKKRIRILSDPLPERAV